MTTLQNACNAITTLVNSTYNHYSRTSSCELSTQKQCCETEVRDTHLLGLLCDESAVDMGVMFLASAANW